MRRRTLVAYANLFRNPNALFPPSASSEGVDVILFPNGQNEIWLKSADGTLGFRIVAGNGPAGLGLQISTFIGTPPVTVRTDDPGSVDSKYVDLCQYRQDDESLAFKAWYDADPATRGDSPINPEASESEATR